MSDITVAKRYAVALFQIAKEQNLINQLEEELRIVNEVFTNDNELLSFLAHPKMTKDAKSTDCKCICKPFSFCSKHCNVNGRTSSYR